MAELKTEPLTKDPKEVVRLFREMGLVGAGGAGFPTYFKYIHPTPTLIVNAEEGEPGFAADKLLLKEHVEEFELILNSLKEIFGFEKIYIGAKEKDRDKLAPLEDRFNIVYTPSLYGMGEERWLTKSVTGIEVPPDKYPPELGVTVNNVETVYNMYRALFLNRPVTQKYLNVYGEVAEPRVYLAPVGTYVMDLLGMTGVITENSHELMCIDGGPMMGDRVDVGSHAVKKTSNGLLVTDRGMFQRRSERNPAWDETLPEIMKKLEIERYLDWEPEEIHDIGSEVRRVKLFLKQCLGQPSRPLVEEGQEVEEGELLGSSVEGEFDDFKCLSVALHAPISGTVKEVAEEYIIIERS
ncbi:MAG: SLBB domain-containing protein [Candidatus Bipolaricaulia bacterium]